ncbi:MAG: copper amine oxidase N-terminal domain-containing protein, partial [Peptococcaceae bacterium]|nr:copper amine oxidase N-terminal domain-containing protein [Peptococcaceae bacterium]
MGRIAKTLVIIFALVLPAQTPALDELKVYVNGTRISFPDQAPYINSEGRTMVPVRFVSQALGAAVDWNEQGKTVNIRQGSKDITLRIGEKKARVEANDVALDAAAALTNNRTMVPLRFVSECLGAGVEWKEAKREIHIFTAAYASDAAC